MAFPVRPHCTSFAVFAAAAVLLAPAPHGSAQTAPADSSRSAAHGAYTAAQAARGETEFRSICGNCHGTSEFSGPAFRSAWSGRRVYDFFDQIRNTMPLDNPGGLSREQYAAVIAYVLKLNQYPAGSSDLPVSDAALKLIKF
jgi:mono/diheme cytochrome c family protein